MRGIRSAGWTFESALQCCDIEEEPCWGEPPRLHCANSLWAVRLQRAEGSDVGVNCARGRLSSIVRSSSATSGLRLSRFEFEQMFRTVLRLLTAAPKSSRIQVKSFGRAQRGLHRMVGFRLSQATLSTGRPPYVVLPIAERDQNLTSSCFSPTY